jgi:hypothetical protein
VGRQAFIQRFWLFPPLALCVISDLQYSHDTVNGQVAGKMGHGHGASERQVTDIFFICLVVVAVMPNASFIIGDFGDHKRLWP